MNVENTAQSLDGNELNAFVEFDVLQMNTGTIQVELKSGTLATATLTIYRSNDRVNWQATVSPNPATITAVGFTTTFCTENIAWLRVGVTTVEGGVSELTVVPCFKGYP